jgi:hypothetical protein
MEISANRFARWSMPMASPVAKSLQARPSGSLSLSGGNATALRAAFDGGDQILSKSAHARAVPVRLFKDVIDMTTVPASATASLS